MDYNILKKYIDNNLTILDISKLENKSQSGIRYWLNKYNLKVNRRTFTLEQFIEVVKNNYSVSSCLSNLNLSPTGSNYRGFYKFQRENNIDISHFTGKFHLKGKSHSFNKIPLDNILVKNCNYSSDRLRKRLINEGLKEHRCECCGLDKWLGEPIPLELDHVDGDHYNNTIENLKILCPNCHAKTPTYRGKNIKYKNNTKNKKQKNKKQYQCLSCNCELKSKSKSKSGLCKDCLSKSQRKVKRPPKEQLIKEIEESSYLAVGRKYGVSDNAIRNWLR